jgi:DNA polymerase-1
MLELPDEIAKIGLNARMLLQVHDELIFEVPQKELQETLALVTRVMENAYSLDIPLSTEAKAGPSWGDMEKRYPDPKNT